MEVLLKNGFRATLFLGLFCSAEPLLACTAGVFHGNITADGRPIYFKVRDTSVRQQQADFFRGEKYNFIGIYTRGDDVTMGLNDAGLVGGNTRSRVEGEDKENYFRNGEFFRHVMSEYGTIREVDEFLQRQLRYEEQEFNSYVSGNFPFIDRTASSVLYEVYKPDRAVSSTPPFVYTFNTEDSRREEQGQLHMVLRTGFFHMCPDGRDNVEGGRRYETARYNMTGLLNESGSLNIRTIIQGNVREEGVRIIGLEMGLGGVRYSGATAYFSAPDRPVSLSKGGGILRLTATVTPQSDPASSGNGFRMVLARTGGTRMIEDGLGSVEMSGYMIGYDPASGSYSFRRRDGTSGNSVSTIGSWNGMESGSDQLPMRKGKEARVTVEIERVGDRAVELRFTVDDGGRRKTVSYTDKESSWIDFDTVAFGSAKEYGVMRIEKIQVTDPSGNELLGDTVRWYQTEYLNESTRPIEAEPGNFEGIRYGPGRSRRAVARHNSMSTQVVQGVLPDEDPALTTAWILLGNPNYAMAVPAWVRMGDRVAESLRSGLMWDLAQSLYRKAGDVHITQSSIFPAEAHLLDTVSNILLPQWRAGGLPPPDEMARIHERMAADACSLLVSLDEVRGDNRAPVIGAIEAVREAGTSSVRFTVDARDPDGEVVSYAWVFGDGGISSEAAPVHAYGTPGQYLVSCTVTDNEKVSITSWRYFEAVSETGPER